MFPQEVSLVCADRTEVKAIQSIRIIDCRLKCRYNCLQRLGLAAVQEFSSVKPGTEAR